jgi:hypothetical protein
VELKIEHGWIPSFRFAGSAGMSGLIPLQNPGWRDPDRGFVEPWILYRNSSGVVPAGLFCPGRRNCSAWPAAAHRPMAR